MVLDAPSPFMKVPEGAWVCANEFYFAIIDLFPVSPCRVDAFPTLEICPGPPPTCMQATA
jgi:hypothetical protein